MGSMEKRQNKKKRKLYKIMDKEKFIEQFNAKAKESQLIAEQHGWFVTNDPELLAAKIALMHSELSEALEGLRHGNPPSDHIPEFSALEEEFADVIIRIMHVADALNLRLGEAIIAKDEFNAKREFKHGGKKF